MAQLYLDSSALVKRYVREAGSTWLQAFLSAGPGYTAATGRLSIVEVVSARNRRVPDGSIPPMDHITLRDDVLALCRREYRIVPVAAALLGRARALLERHPRRACDALHLASALAATGRRTVAGQPVLAFLVADGRLLAAASAEGLPVDHPEQQP
jgi:predicted nucleic acid-binding protein